MGDREEFLPSGTSTSPAPAAKKLLDWLDKKTDFFTAPASTRFHGACEGGLCMHSLNVYHALHDTFFTEGDSEETFAICALLHDLCKANYYKAGTRNVKNDVTGQWEKVPSYSVEDLFPYGHGEKSVFLIERFMKLKIEGGRRDPLAHGRLLTTQPRAAALPFRKPTTSTRWPSSCTSQTLRPPISWNTTPVRYDNTQKSRPGCSCI